MACRKAAASISSKALVGTKNTTEGRPGWWPALPARCTNRETPLGLPIWITRSTGRKSTPKSKLEVQTTTFRMPSCSAFSTQLRMLLSKDPWCMAIHPAQSGLISKIFWYHISVWERVFVKSKTDLPASMVSMT